MKRVSLFASVFIAVAIFILSVIPGIGNGLNSGFEKHLAAYFLLSLSIGIYFGTCRFSAPFLRAALLAGTFGVLIELVQYFIPYRSCEVLDALADYAGASIPMVSIFLLRPVTARGPK
jgi:VanZ family protein